VDNASYPTAKIADNFARFSRPLGLGYANLGALLMSIGLAVRFPMRDATWAGRYLLTALMCGEAYAQSSRNRGTYGAPSMVYEVNRDPMLDVIRMHRDAIRGIQPDPCAARTVLLAAGGVLGTPALQAPAKNSATRIRKFTVLAPTGTIGFMMDCDTTGIEPESGSGETQEGWLAAG